MPIINKIKLPRNDYSPVIAFMIDCSSGDNSTWQYIDSLSDFYKKYNTFEYSPSFEYATNLLSLGYKIVTKNRNTKINKKNIRIFKNSKVTHIDVNRDYTSNIAIGTELSTKDLLSFDIEIKSIEDQDYVLLNNGYYNVLVWWNISNVDSPPIPTEFYFKLIELKDTFTNSLIETLRGLSYKVEQLSSKRIRIYNFTDLSIVKTSSSNINVDYSNNNGTYDSLAYYYDTIKVADFVSKIPSSSDDIKFKLVYDGIKFSISVYKYSLNTIIFNEYFTDINITNLLKKVNLNSTLIEVIIHTDDPTVLSSSLLGIYELKRDEEEESESTFSPDYEELIDKYYFDIYVDLFNETLPSGDYVLFSKNRNNQNNNLVIFEDNDILLKNNTKLDITFAFLYSYIKNYSFLGTVDFKFSLRSYNNDYENNDLINKIKFDNFSYYIDKCRIKNKELSVSIVPILLSNYLKRTLTGGNIPQQRLLFLLDNFQSYMNEDIVKSITITNFDNSVLGKLLIQLELQLTYESIDIIEDISLDLLY